MGFYHLFCCMLVQIPTIVIPTVTDSKKEEDKQREVSSWRTGLRKTGSTSAVLENNKDEADKNLSRSLSSPRIPVERNSVDNVSVVLAVITCLVFLLCCFFMQIGITVSLVTECLSFNFVIAAIGNTMFHFLLIMLLFIIKNIILLMTSIVFFSLLTDQPKLSLPKYISQIFEKKSFLPPYF